jgi:3',5'-cyclic AMP phosphodiesterase CpdA
MTHTRSKPAAKRSFAIWLLATLVLAAAAVWGVSAQDVTLPGKPDSLKFVVISDLHAAGDQSEYAFARHLAEFHATFPFEMVIMAGDIIAGSPRPRDFTDRFEKPFAPLLDAGIPFYETLGNHENPSVRFYKAWNMGGERYYSLTRKGVRFFMLDSNDIDPPQRGWIDDALRKPPDGWRIVVVHHPLYSDGKTHGSQVGVRSVVEPMLVKYGVNVVFSGHDHIYERFKPQKGITYFVSGGAGPVRKGDVKPSDMTAACFDQDQFFIAVEIDGDDLYFSAISRAGKVVDSGVIHRGSAK